MKVSCRGVESGAGVVGLLEVAGEVHVGVNDATDAGCQGTAAGQVMSCGQR